MCTKVTGAQLWDAGHFYVNNDYRSIFSHDFTEPMHNAILNLCKLLYCNLASYRTEFAQVTILNTHDY